MMTTSGGRASGATQPISTRLERSCRKLRTAVPRLLPSWRSMSAVSLVRRLMILHREGGGRVGRKGGTFHNL